MILAKTNLNIGLSIFKNDGDLGSLAQDQSEPFIEDVSNEDDFIEDHLLFNQFAGITSLQSIDEFVLGEYEGDSEPSGHNEIDGHEVDHQNEAEGEGHSESRKHHSNYIFRSFKS